MTVRTKVSTKDIDEAYLRLKNIVKETPLQLTITYLKKYNCNVYLKREDLQWVRSFKLRGAYNAISVLSNEEKIKVLLVQVLEIMLKVLLILQKLNLKAVIFMPVTTPRQKINQVKFFGDNNVEIVLIGDTFDHCLAQALNYTKQHKMNFIDPFNNVYTIAGQGTIAKEILNQAEKEDNTFDYVFAAIGGGGLISGVSTYFKTHSPH